MHLSGLWKVALPELQTSYKFSGLNQTKISLQNNFNQMSASHQILAIVIKDKRVKEILIVSKEETRVEVLRLYIKNQIAVNIRINIQIIIFIRYLVFKKNIYYDTEITIKIFQIVYPETRWYIKTF